MQNISEIIAQGKWPPKKYDSAYIKGFDHWYLPKNIERIDNVLKNIKIKSTGEDSLDIGFGNPIVLEREQKIFRRCKGLYINLDEAINKGISKSIIIEGNCYQIPFDSDKFDVVSAYALLHIIPDIPEFYKEAYRVLKSGGSLYTDGDRNLFISKIVRRIGMLKCYFSGNKEQFEYWRDLLNVKESYHQEGINYSKLKKVLKQIGFSKVIIVPWFSANPEWDKIIVYKLVTKLLTLLKVKVLSTHIQILAIK